MLSHSCEKVLHVEVLRRAAGEAFVDEALEVGDCGLVVLIAVDQSLLIVTGAAIGSLSFLTGSMFFKFRIYFFYNKSRHFLRKRHSFLAMSAQRIYYCSFLSIHFEKKRYGL